MVATLVLALIGAPASSALRNECDLCPRTCPMHRDHAERSEPGHKLHCHAAPADHQQHARQDGSRHPSVARASCGNHGVMPATVLPPVILPAALSQSVIVTAQRAPVADTVRHGRTSDPPDTPPPIGAA